MALLDAQLNAAIVSRVALAKHVDGLELHHKGAAILDPPRRAGQNADHRRGRRRQQRTRLRVLDVGHLTEHIRVSQKGRDALIVRLGDICVIVLRLVAPLARPEDDL